MTWHDAALCKGDKNPERWFRMMPHEVRDMQDICALCPARPGCGKEAMEQEGDVDAQSRWGFRAYMTPIDRAAIHAMGGLQGRDPMKVILDLKKKQAKKKFR